MPDPTPAQPQPLIGYSQPPAGFARQAQAQTQTQVRRRRVARMMVVGSAVGALLLTVLAWRVLDAEGRGDRRDTTGSSASTTGPEGRSSDSARDSSSDSSESSDSSNSSGSAAPGAGEPTAGAASPSSASSQQPRPEPYPLVMLDAKNSVNLRNPDAEAKGRTGDIRFGCQSIGCELESDTSVFLQLYGKPGGTLDECRRMLKHRKNHRLPLAGAANGSEICIKGPSGDIALFVISTKSTAMPDIAFLQGALTIWREAA